METQNNPYDELLYAIIGGAMEVYNYFGPGLLESLYEKNNFFAGTGCHHPDLGSFFYGTVHDTDKDDNTLI